MFHRSPARQVAAILTLALTVATPTAAQFELVDLEIGHVSSHGPADLARGHRVAFRIFGRPGDVVLLLASTSSPPGSPPSWAGVPLEIDPAAAFAIIDGRSDPAARVGASGRFERIAVMSRDVPVGGRLWMQAALATPGEVPRLLTGIAAEFVDVHVFEFDADSGGWTGGFADYPSGSEQRYGLAFDRSLLPAPLSSRGHGMRMHGHNHSDDLFMFLKRRVHGLQPGEVYAVDVSVDLVSRYPAEAAGIGGSPGSSVYLRGGASTQEPRGIVGSDGYVRMNIDKGNQGQAGRESEVLGHIGIPGSDPVPTLVARQTPRPVRARADATGGLWLHVGTDSGFEGVTEVWYERIVATVRR